MPSVFFLLLFRIARVAIVRLQGDPDESTYSSFTVRRSSGWGELYSELIHRLCPTWPPRLSSFCRGLVGEISATPSAKYHTDLTSRLVACELRTDDTVIYWPLHSEHCLAKCRL